MNSHDQIPDDPILRFRTGGLLVAPFFLAFAVVLALGTGYASIPSAATPKFNRKALATGPARTILATNPPTLQLNGFRRTCMECHRVFSNPDPRVTKLEQHKHIKLHHGINTHCYNCHDFEDRNYLALRNGSKLPYSRSPELCGQCHGPVYRDWQRGLHGKRRGHWDRKLGEVRQMICTGCHNPHWPSRPAMSGLEPLPGPHTLRMGEFEGHHENEHDPLIRALHGAPEDHR